MRPPLPPVVLTPTVVPLSSPVVVVVVVFVPLPLDEPPIETVSVVVESVVEPVVVVVPVVVELDVVDPVVDEPDVVELEPVEPSLLSAGASGTSNPDPSDASCTDGAAGACAYTPRETAIPPAKIVAPTERLLMRELESARWRARGFGCSSTSRSLTWFARVARCRPRAGALSPTTPTFLRTFPKSGTGVSPADFYMSDKYLLVACACRAINGGRRSDSLN